MLWGRSGNRCAMPDCRIELVMDMTETDDESLIGEECHIIAQKPDGPRGDESYPFEKIDKYENLVLLCRNHHKIIDDNPLNYPIDKLQSLKHEHEAWVKEKLANFNEVKQRDEEIYATYIDKWTEYADVYKWKNWTSWMLNADEPRLIIEMDEKLLTLRDWLFSRIWPKRYPQLEDAFENFRVILQDMQNTFHEHAKKENEFFLTEKFYHINEWNPERYEALSKKYHFHVFLVEDLMIELTRAANYICDNVRKYIDPSFRINEGLLIIQIGPFMGFEFREYRVEYKAEERLGKPYPSLEEFKKIRTSRDYCRGIGSSEYDPLFLQHYR